MINIFQFAPDDQSIFYLSRIFGSVGTLFQSGGSPDTVLAILGVMFKVFNSIVLAVGALIVFYVTIVGVMATAHEGEFLGKKWHSLWVPIRTVLGIAALIPTPTGYSGIQIVLMWIVLQGVGAADTIWSTALGYIKVAGSATTQITIPSLGVNQSLQTLFQGLACQATAKAAYANPSGLSVGGYYCKDNSSETFCRMDHPFDPRPAQSSYVMGPAGTCGTLKYCNQNAACSGSPSSDTSPTSIGCLACKGQIQALKDIIPTLSTIAEKFADVDYQYRRFYYTSFDTSRSVAPPWIQDYCSAQSIAHCCVPFVLPIPLISNACQGSRGDFYSVDANKNAQNASNDAVSKLYWKYNLQPFLRDSADFVTLATNLYVNTITKIMTDQITQQALDPSNLSNQLAEARKYGWIFAGAYYYTIAQQNNNNLQKANVPFAVQAVDPASTSTGPLYNYRNNFTAARALTDQAVQQGFGSGADINNNVTFALDSAPGQLNSQLSSAGSSIMSSFMGTVSGSRPGEMAVNPLAGLQSLGEKILLSIEVLFVGIVSGTTALALLGNLSVFVLGSGVENPVGPAMTTVYLLLVPVILGFMAVFTAIGGLLAVYTPLIPYIIFTIGVIGWFTSVIETMVAAPLVALGILSPGGHHEILGKAEPALMLIFAVFLRPGLMIFGLIASMLLAIVAVTMINAGFASVMGAIAHQLGKGSPGFLELIFFLSAYVFIVITVLNKCFALIYIVPERVMRWIGGQADQFGEAEALGAVKGGVEAAGGTAAGAAAGAKGSIEGTGAKWGEHMKQRENRRKTESAKIDDGEKK